MIAPASRHGSLRLVVALGFLAGPPAAWAQSQQSSPQPPTVVYTVDVIGTTPLPGIDLRLDQIPAPVQTLNQLDIDRTVPVDVADLLNRRLSGVTVNEIQGNPFQADVSYRGYSASPLLGTPQGLSVYMDGVRLNQPFGEVVSWDLIPLVAVSSGALMPGSNPMFGLNTLGGALAIQTKDGKSNPGTNVQAIYGSDARRAVEFEHGGSRANGVSWYLAGNFFAEDGWRDDSPSTVRQVFGKLGWRQAKIDFKLTAAYANNALTGNGLQEQRFLDRDYASVYTKPDKTDNHGTFLNLTAQRDVSARLSIAANAYYRRIGTSTINGDINEDSLDQNLYQPNAVERAALAAAGYTGFPTSGENASNTPFPYWRCIANVLLNDAPAETCNGLVSRTDTVQHNAGASGQATFRRASAARSNQLTVGAAYDGSGIGFQQSTELGYLNPDRSVTGLNAFADGGVTGGFVNGEPFDTRVDLDGHVRTWSAYATDTLSLRDVWHITLSGRFNHSAVTNTDLISPGGGIGSLDSAYAYRRFNPAAGFTFRAAGDTVLYVGYSEGSRAPASVELGCADPAAPCKLPNAMAGDPPLQQVVTRTFEYGIRGEGNRLTWSAGGFRAENRDDILFVASQQTGFGYFKNFGRTRRQGLELDATGRMGRLTLDGGYTFLDATYQSQEALDGSSNSTNDAAESGGKGLEGTIEIVPGDRIPLIPRHLVKVFATVQATNALSVTLGVVGASGSFARGNENNLHQPDGTYYLGPGETGGYAVANLTGRYQLTRWLQVLAQANNLFDRHYFTAAQLGPAAFTDAGTFIARPFPPVGGEFPIQRGTFYAPAAPRLFWVGTRVRF
jgi:outer membrane receptor protein involved in Fe transport